MYKAFFKRIAIIALLLYCLGLLVNISTRDDYQWDFWIYYNAARAHAAGLNPYQPEALAQISQSTIRHSFAYPPILLFFFHPFTKLDFKTALYLFLALKGLLLIGLILIWKKEFLRKEVDLLFYFFCLLAFNGTIYIDMGAGNISIIEQLLIWLGFVFYLKRRLLLFCSFILLAATFKLVPILFLALLWFAENKKKYVYFWCSSLVFVLLLLASYLITPVLFTDFVHGTVGRTDWERGIVNPSTLAFLRDAFALLETGSGFAVPYRAQLLLYVAIIAAIFGVTWRAYVALSSVKTNQKERWVIFLACLVYVLVLPRIKDYSYILLLVPSFFILKNIGQVKGYPLIIAATISLSLYSTNRVLPLPGIDAVFKLLSSYHPLIIAYTAWGLYLHHIFSLAKRSRLVASY